jgi:hypothetical protein
MRRPCFLSGPRGSSRGPGAEARRPLTAGAARQGAASDEQHSCSVKSLRVHAACDLHSSDMAWRYTPRLMGSFDERIERHSSIVATLERVPPLRRLAYAMRTASKAIALFAH